MAFIAPILPFLGTIGAGVSAVSSIAGGMYQGQVAENNATIATQNATYAKEAGQQQAATESAKGAAKQGELKTALAANNVDVNSGSAVDVESGERGTDVLDTATVLNNADLTAYGYTTQATNDKAQAQQDEEGGILTGVGGLLGKASSINLGGLGGSGGYGGSSNDSNY